MPPTQSPARPLPSPSELAPYWSLDPNICFLNHGSFGATPRAVQAAQTRYRELIEREPVDFFVNQHQGLMDKVRTALAEFTGADAEGFALVPNATIGITTAFDGMSLKPGDEILINDQEYPACQNNIRRIAARSGARVVVAEPPFPCPSPEAIVESIVAKVTPRTRAALISHVTSPTGLILPVEAIARELYARRVMVIVDGAHAPGMVPNLEDYGYNAYIANCHKWICSPKGSAFMWVDFKEREFGSFRPLVLSNNAEKPKPGRDQFLTEFDYVGTQDYTSIYAIPDAIAFMASLVPGGWPEIMARNHALVLKGRNIICNALDIQPTAPDSMVGSICTMILPPRPPELQAKLAARPTRYSDALQDALLARHRIQVPIWGIPSRPSAGRFIRISAQLYNTPEQYEYLASALKEELAAEARL